MLQNQSRVNGLVAMPLTNLKQSPHNLVQLILSGWDQVAAEVGINYFAQFGISSWSKWN
jgi:hypothetical protein